MTATRTLSLGRSAARAYPAAVRVSAAEELTNWRRVIRDMGRSGVGGIGGRESDTTILTGHGRAATAESQPRRRRFGTPSALGITGSKSPAVRIPPLAGSDRGR